MAIHFHRKTLDEMQAEADWSEAEQKLLADAHTGYVIIAKTRPDEATEANRIRADLIAHITRGGCDDCRVPDKGVAVVGAFITGALDLQGCDTPLDLWLDSCRFDSQPKLLDARLGAVILPGCAMPGLSAHRLRVTRSILLNHEFASEGTVDFSSAQIGQTIDCTSGTLDGRGKTALNMDAITIGADLFLRDGFAATGLVNLTGANVTGQVACVGGTFDGQGKTALNMDAITIGADLFLRDGFAAMGPVNLVRASVAGQVACDAGIFDGQGGTALNMNTITVGADLYLCDDFSLSGLVDLNRGAIIGSLVLSGGTFKGGMRAEALTVGGPLHCHGVTDWTGPLDLTDAHVGRLHDDAQSWAKADPLILNGFRYDRLSGDMRISERLDWLSRKFDRQLEPAFGEPVEQNGSTWRKPTPFIPSYQKGFDPQPYTQLAKVLREQGVTQGAARILEERDRRTLRASYHRAVSSVDGTWRAGWAAQWAILRRPFDWLFGVVFGYGHRPARALFWVLGIFALNWWLYAQVWEAGQMAPTAPVVLTSADWTQAVEDYDKGTGPLPLLAWRDSKTAQDYTAFNAPLYALDLFIPLDALGQEAAWAPSPVRGIWGKVAFWSGPVTQLLGWIITAIAAAAVAGIVGKKD